MKTQNACHRWEQSTLQDAPPFREEELGHRGTQDIGHWTGYIQTQQPQAASSHFEGHTMYSCEVKSCWRNVGQAQVENTSCNGYKDRFHLCFTLPISGSLALLPETCSTDLHLRMINFKLELLLKMSWDSLGNLTGKDYASFPCVASAPFLEAALNFKLKSDWPYSAQM